MNSALPQKDAAKMENHVFRIYDENNDGHVDFVEFMVVSLVDYYLRSSPASGGLYYHGGWKS